MKSARENRMETLKANGLDTTKFFNLNMDIPVGSDVEIRINGIPYVFNSSTDAIAKKIMDDGYIFNSKVDGRWITAQTFRMLNGISFNSKTRECETGFDAYLRNDYPYMYQFSMMLDEVHRLARMERDNDPDFARLSKFFTKEVVYETCKHYIRQLKKYVKNQKSRKCKGVPYCKLNKYGNVFLKDLNEKVYNPLEMALVAIKDSKNYKMIEGALKKFMNIQCKLPYDTPKSVAWKTSFKGIGAYKTLNNIVKHHGVVLTNYETGEKLNRDESVAYIESLLETYKGGYWKYHELLKKAIADNNFDLRKSIEAQDRN